MKDDIQDDIHKAIQVLLAKINSDVSAFEALQLAQAALHLAQVDATFAHTSKHLQTP